jgi:multidrug resistance efflux pump
MVTPATTGSQEPVIPEAGSDRPPPGRDRRASFRRWRARFIVVVLIVAAVFLGLKVNQARSGAAAQIDLGTVTLTAQVIPVETARAGQVVSVDIRAAQKVTAGQQVGTLQVTTTNSQGNPVTSTVRLTAPSDGIVVDDPVTVGTTVQPGESFADLYDPAKFTFSGHVSLNDLPEIGPGMVATLRAEGLTGDLKAVVDRLVPPVGSDQASPKSGQMELVLLPQNKNDVAGLVPGLRFTGSVDTRTGDPNSKHFVRLGG